MLRAPIDKLNIGFAAIQSLLPLGRKREVDHHDRVLFDNADQQDHSDESDDGERDAEQKKRGDRPQSGRGKPRLNGSWNG